MTNPAPRPVSGAENTLFHPGLMQLPRTVPVPQIIPEWTVDHLGKKVRLIHPYFDGSHTWLPHQVGTLDGLHTGTGGVECYVYFDDDDDDEGDFSAPVTWLMPVYEDNSQAGLPEDGGTPAATLPRLHSFLQSCVVKLLFWTGMNAKRHKEDD